MKRFTTSVLGLMLIGALIAQDRKSVQAESTNYQSTEADVSVQKPSNAYPKVLDLFEEDFSNGYAGNNGVGEWLPESNTAINGDLWRIGAVDGTPPAFGAFGSLALTSATSSNGYAWCDLFGYNSPLVPDWEDITATLTTPELDFTDNNSVILEYTQRIAYCCFSFSPITIDVSNDGGASWLSFPAEGEFIPDANANSGNITTQVDVSCVAAGESSVLIRFGYDTEQFGGFGFYSWSIDDVLIFETETINDLSIRQIANGDVFNIFEYRVTPIQQAIPEGDGGLLVAAMFSNKGSADQTNCTVTAEILDAGGIVVSTTVSDPFDFPANGSSLTCPTVEDTMYMQTGWVPEETGDYTLRFTLQSDQTEETPDDNVQEMTIVYTSCMYGHDDEGALDTEWRASDDQDTPGSFENTGYGNIYTVHSEGSLGIGALVRLGPNTDPEFEAEIRTMEYDGATQSVNDAAFSSTFYEIAPEDIPESEEESFNIYIEFDDEIELEPGMFYFVSIVNDNISQDELSVMAQTNSDTDFSGRRIARSGAGDFIWFSETATPAVRMIVDEPDCFTTGPSGLNEYEELNVELSQNTPNPVSGLATIQYTMEESMNLKFEILDSRGRLVMQENLGSVSPGQHIMEIDMSSYETGLYHYSLISGNKRMSKRMIVAH